FDRQGRLVKAEGITSHSRATVGECGEWRAGRRIEAFDSDSGHADAALPDWLRPEWVQPVMRGGQRLGTVVVLPDQLHREPTRRIVDSGGTTLTVGLREDIGKTSMFEEIVGTSPPLRTVLSQVSKVAPTDSTVLITGETGTGKELVARAIHKRSPRSRRAFV